eukprot:5080405-Karenia_brevis.AAC.1
MPSVFGLSASHVCPICCWPLSCECDMPPTLSAMLASARFQCLCQYICPRSVSATLQPTAAGP